MSEHSESTPPPPAEGSEESRSRSELEEGVEHLGRALGGVMSKLLGEKVTGIRLEADRPVIGAEADQALDELGSTAGRWLRAAGEGLKRHPASPGQALETMLEERHAPVQTEEGIAPLTAGLKNLAGGLYKSTEAVLDKVAPRKARPEGGEGPDGAAGPGPASEE